MLAVMRSVGVAPEMNLDNPLGAGNKACKRMTPPWLCNTGQTSPEIQNRDVSGLRRKTDVLIFSKKVQTL